MKKIHKYIIISAILIFSNNVFAADIDKGKEKSVTCVVCHGQDGVSVNPLWPKLAGQHASYLKSQLYEFQKGPNGNRNNAIMTSFAAGLSDEDIEDLATYFSEQKGLKVLPAK